MRTGRNKSKSVTGCTGAIHLLLLSHSSDVRTTGTARSCQPRVRRSRRCCDGERQPDQHGAARSGVHGWAWPNRGCPRDDVRSTRHVRLAPGSGCSDGLLSAARRRWSSAATKRPWHLRPTRPTRGLIAWAHTASDAVCAPTLSPWFLQAVRQCQGSTGAGRAISTPCHAFVRLLRITSPLVRGTERPQRRARRCRQDLHGLHDPPPASRRHRERRM